MSKYVGVESDNAKIGELFKALPNGRIGGEGGVEVISCR